MDQILHSSAMVIELNSTKIFSCYAMVHKNSLSQNICYAMILMLNKWIDTQQLVKFKLKLSHGKQPHNLTSR